MPAKLPTLPAALLADARALVAESSDETATRACAAPIEWVEDAVSCVLKTARRQRSKKVFGSLDTGRVLTWSLVTGYQTRTLAFLLVGMVDSGAVDAV